MADASLNIYQKLVEVRKAIPGIAKDARTKSAGAFKYVSSNNILSEVRPLLDSYGLLLVVSVKQARLLDKWRGNDKQNEHMTELDMEFVWVNADKPDEQIVCPWYGQGLDTGEKGVGKAATYAEKYFLLKFFNVPTDEDDPDVGHRNRGSTSRLETPADDVQNAQYHPSGAPANAAAERFDQTPAVFPDPAAVVDMETFAQSMTAIGIIVPESVTKCKAAAGFATEGLDQLDVDALRHVYTVGRDKALQLREATR